MSILNKVFLKKNKDIKKDEIIDISPTSEEGDLGQAEQIAKVIDIGIKNENYSAINKQLSSIVSNDETREQYVFKYKGIFGNIIANVICGVSAVFFIYLSLISMGTIIFSGSLRILGVVGLVCFCSLAFFNGVIIKNLILMIKYKIRFNAYEEMLKIKKMEYIDSISEYTKTDSNMIIEDLNAAIDKKLIPQGHFTNENLVFMVSDKSYDKYSENAAAYDRYFKKQIEERKRVKSRTRAVEKILDTGESYIKKFNGFETEISDKVILKKIEHIKTVTSLIFHEVDINSRYAKSLGMFLNYYLPTTDKLLEEYVSIGKKDIKGKVLTRTRKEIEEALDTIVTAYDQLLENIYEEQEIDILSDISAVEMMIKQDGLSTTK